MSEEQVEEEAIRLLETNGFKVINSVELEDAVYIIVLASYGCKEDSVLKELKPSLEWLCEICNIKIENITRFINE